MSAVPEPGYCTNALPQGLASRGTGARSCGFPLHQIAVDYLPEGHPALIAQTRIEQMLTVRSPETMRSFARLRSVAALLFACATTDELDAMPALVEAEWLRLEAERDAQASARRDRGREGPRKRVWMATPPSHLLAAVAATALWISDAQDERTAIARLEPTFEAARRGRRSYQHASAWFPFPGDLAQAWDALAQRRSRIAAVRAAERTRELPLTFEPRHVPQILSDELFLPILKQLAVGLSDEIARTYGAMCLARLAGAPDWGAAGTAIGLDRTHARGIANNSANKLRRAGTTESFRDEMHEIASKFASHGLIDYSVRRARFASFELPVTHWEAICQAADLPTGRGDSRRRCASLWLWAELTGQHWRNAPSFYDTQGDRIRFARFKKAILPALHGALSAYAERIAAEPAVVAPMARPRVPSPARTGHRHRYRGH